MSDCGTRHRRAGGWWCCGPSTGGRIWNRRVRRGRGPSSTRLSARPHKRVPGLVGQGGGQGRDVVRRRRKWAWAGGRRCVRWWRKRSSRAGATGAPPRCRREGLSAQARFVTHLVDLDESTILLTVEGRSVRVLLFALAAQGAVWLADVKQVAIEPVHPVCEGDLAAGLSRSPGGRQVPHLAAVRERRGSG